MLDDDEAKALWKAHFANQITLAEKSAMLIFQSQHLKNNEVKQLQLLSKGEFNERTLQKLVTKLSSTFEPYKPDKAIMQYLNQHTRQLGLEAPSFASPQEKQKTQTNLRDKKRLLLIGRKEERINPTENLSEQALPISKRNLATSREISL